eukprot:256198-Alexandrium_andersonii.AAC.1
MALAEDHAWLGHRQLASKAGRQDWPGALANSALCHVGRTTRGSSARLANLVRQKCPSDVRVDGAGP